jgi:peptidoglycan hydrolase-like protein with peptidoglycan-binding domain/outer membrane biosynthesis protein TonB
VEIAPRHWLGALVVTAAVALPMGPASTAMAQNAGAEARSGASLRLGDGYERWNGSSQVRNVQRMLRRVGYEVGPLDGLFGPQTRAAVQWFQSDHGLRSRGVVNSATLRRLRLSAASVRFGDGYGSSTGSRRIRAMQRILRKRGYEVGPLDGVFGAQTLASVQQFQSDHGLRPNGIVGPATLRNLRASGGERVGERMRAPAPRADIAGRSLAGTRPQPSRGHADVGGPSVWSFLVAALGALLVAGLLLAGAREIRNRRAKPTPQPAPSAAKRTPRPDPRPAKLTPQPDPSAAKRTPRPDPRPAKLTPQPDPTPAKQQKPEPDPSPAKPTPQPDPTPAIPSSVAAPAAKVAAPPAKARARASPARHPRAVGYAAGHDRGELEGQATAIRHACSSRGWTLVRLVRGGGANAPKASRPPGLDYALEQLSRGTATHLVVGKLEQVGSPADVTALLRWCARYEVDLVALDADLDTTTGEGRLAAQRLLAVGRA